MAQKVKSSLQKVTLNIVKGNKEILELWYPAMGWSVAARRILDDYCRRLEELESQEVKASGELLDVEISLEDIKTD